MRKVNLEKKIDLALKELTDCFRYDLDINTKVDVMRFKLVSAISYLCMIDDWEVENRCTFFCLSEIEKNLNNFVEERKRKENENGDK